MQRPNESLYCNVFSLARYFFLDNTKRTPESRCSHLNINKPLCNICQLYLCIIVKTTSQYVIVIKAFTATHDDVMLISVQFFNNRQ